MQHGLHACMYVCMRRRVLPSSSKKRRPPHRFALSLRHRPAPAPPPPEFASSTAPICGPLHDRSQGLVLRENLHGRWTTASATSPPSPLATRAEWRRGLNGFASRAGMSFSAKSTDGSSTTASTWCVPGPLCLSIRRARAAAQSSRLCDSNKHIHRRPKKTDTGAARVVSPKVRAEGNGEPFQNMLGHHHGPGRRRRLQPVTEPSKVGTRPLRVDPVSHFFHPLVATTGDVLEPIEDIQTDARPAPTTHR